MTCPPMMNVTSCIQIKEQKFLVIFVDTVSSVAGCHDGNITLFDVRLSSGVLVWEISDFFKKPVCGT